MFYNSRSHRVSGSVVPLGFILVIAIIATSIIVFNTTTLPSLSKNAEVDAHRDVETDFIKMDTSIYRAATTGIPQPVVIGNRVDYPPSIVPLKTPAPRFVTKGPHNVSFENTVYTSNTTNYTKKWGTNGILYSRDYNFFTTARDFGYEHGMFYTQPNNAEHGNTEIIVRDKQTLVNGKTITFVTVHGDVSFSRPSPSQIAISPETDKETHMNLTNSAGERLRLYVPTRIPKAEWQESLKSELISNDGHIADIQYRETNPNTGDEEGVNYVIIELEQGVEYDFNFYVVEVDKY